MSKVSIIIPSRNERFLNPTVDDLFNKAAGEIEVIVVLEGYWPEVMPADRPGLKFIHWGRARGMRNAVNAAAEIATGKYLMKTDAHCMYGPKYDKILQADCQPNWVAAPRRYALDPEAWQRKNKHPIDYLYADPPDESNDNEINVRVWNEKNYDQDLKEKLIDDIFTFQGSCWFMHLDYYFELELMDVKNYGTFRKEPQEITFKCWLSGGRVIRNKKTWYAHLHKGRKYGRGYASSKRDYKKGDVYLTNWLSDSAWDKQTIPFKWMIDKFEMPGWEDFDWSKWQKTPTKERKMTRIYQNIPLPGVRVQNKNRENSQFWNEGKWKNFILPFLPEDCSDLTFVEMGCNAGLFLKMAEDKRFCHVVGIEKDRTPVKIGLEYRDSIGYKYRILKRTLGGKFGEAGSFDMDELPIADYTLLSTFHYYIDINAWLKYLDRIRSKTHHVIIVSRPDLKRKHWMAAADLYAIDQYFQDWELSQRIDEMDPTGDPSPRYLFSLIYDNPTLERRPMSGIKLRERSDDPMFEAMTNLAKMIAVNLDVDPFKTEYFERWQERKDKRWSDRTLHRFVRGKYDMMLDLKENGLRDALIVDRDGRLCDGGHRLAMMKALGYKSAIVRVTP